ncbi:MAG TPA: DNA modification methylase [Dehalococcoidia bacterium]|nr:DNA modification methylase [Dehalococcoidia bacterium]
MDTPEIPITSIELGERFRKDYGNIEQLMFSIKKNGLITPVAVGVADKVKVGRETDLPYILLAGGRRMAALTAMGWTSIPVRIYDQPISELDLRSIELAENFDRKSMEYAEEIALMRQINNLQIEIHGPKITRSPDAPGWSQADTAKLVKKDPSTVAKDLQLAEAIERFPELQLDKCKNKADAFKRLKNVTKTLNNSAQASAYTKSAGANDKVFKRLSSSYIIGDCLETFKKIPNNTLDFIEIDPPYAIDLQKVKKDNECMGYNEIDKMEYASFMSKVFQESYRVLREGSWLVCWFAADPWFQEIASLMQGVGFKMNLIPGIWAKPNGQTAQPETFLGNAYEMFFYARKGQAKLQRPGRSNIFQHNPVPHTKKYHPTQRPIELMQDVYTTFAKPGTNGFIPFLGSGVGLIVGHNNSINMIGTDLTQQFKDGYILQLKEMLGATE